MHKTGEIRAACRALGNAAVLAGILILMMGAYYEIVKAGIPYQDPPPELQIQYAVNLGTGDELCRIGFLTLLSGLALRVVLRLMAGKKT